MSRNPLYYLVAVAVTALALAVLMDSAGTWFLNPAQFAAGGIVGPLAAGLLFQYDDVGSIGAILAKAVVAGAGLGGTYFALIVVSEYDTAALAAGEAPREALEKAAVVLALVYLAILALVNLRRLLVGPPERSPDAAE